MYCLFIYLYFTQYRIRVVAVSLPNCLCFGFSCVVPKAKICPLQSLLVVPVTYSGHRARRRSHVLKGLLKGNQKVTFIKQFSFIPSYVLKDSYSQYDFHFGKRLRRCMVYTVTVTVLKFEKKVKISFI